MRLNKWVRSTLIALLLVAPASQATLVGYEVLFTLPAGDPFFRLDSADGMIYVDDTLAAGAIVDHWMFNVTWSGLFIGGATEQFEGGSCLISTCTAAGTSLLFDLGTVTLAGEVFDGASNKRLSFFPPTLTSAVPIFQYFQAGATLAAANGTASLQLKSVPEPTPLILLGLGLFMLGFRSHLLFQARNRR